jgi:hypothetical protein
MPNEIETPASPTNRETVPVKARRRRDEIVVGMVLRVKHKEGQPWGQSSAERALWQAVDDMAGPRPSPLVESLALSVLLCEHDLRERQLLTADTKLALDGRVQAATNGAMRRYLAACRALTIARRMDVPAIQVNIGGQQVISNG